jgi:hypothetical protein
MDSATVMREQRSKPGIEVAISSLNANARVLSGGHVGNLSMVWREAVRASHECPHLKIEIWGTRHLNLLRFRLGPRHLKCTGG